MGRRNSLAARRAVGRWAWRLFRREWSQHLLVLSLLTVTVATAIVGVTIAYHLASPAEAWFGDADARIEIAADDPQVLAEDLARIEESAGPIEVIGHRFVPMPGSVRQIELRSQDPYGRYGEPMLALVTGRYPAGPDETAVTTGLAQSLQVGVGETIALGGGEPDRIVVGVVENPNLLSDEFALLAPATAEHPDMVTVLAATGAVPPSVGDRALVSLPADDPLFAALGVLLATALGMLLVCLIAGASFVVIAQRRLRQLGMLAAVGATRRQLRLVTVMGGALTGAVATILGTGVGLAGWFAVAPWLETVAMHRIDPLTIPWWAVLACAGLALLTATAAAWWPARLLTRVPTTEALSARPPRSRPARRTSAVAAVLLGIGVPLLLYADHTRPGPDNNWAQTPLWELTLILGTVLTIVGVLFVGPLAIRLLSAAGTRCPVPIRLALRDLGRYRARSAAALAAITLGLAVTVFLILTTAATTPGDGEGNLTDRQLLVWIEDGRYAPVLTPDALAVAAAEVDRLAATLDEPTVVALEQATAHGAAVTVGRRTADGSYQVERLYVATPELLDYYEVVPDAGVEILSARAGELDLLVAGHPDAATQAAPLPEIRHSSLPRSLITPAALEKRGWQARPAAWLVESSEPLTSEQLAAAHDVAAAAGLAAETRWEEDITSVTWVMTAAAAALALGILAATIGLIRGESTRDLRALAAIGATGRTRRGINAATAGALALAATLLATGCAYLLVGPLYPAELDLTNVPVIQLALVVAGIPLAAVTGGWLLAGRQPSASVRAAIG